jgi:signal transduction histidine kinase
VHITLLLGAALLFGGALMLKLTEQELLDQRVASLRVVAEAIAGALGDVMDPKQDIEDLRPRVVKLLQLLPPGTDGNVWMFDDHTIKPVFFQGPGETTNKFSQQLLFFRLFPEPQTELSYTSLWFGRGDPAGANLKLTVPLVHQGEFAGVLMARFPLGSVARRVQSSFKILLAYVLIYGAVLFIFGLYQLNRNVVRPIGILMASTLQVTDGNLDEQVSESGPVEIASLARSFNIMVGALRDSRRRTDEYILSLQQANEKLKQTSDELIRSEKIASVGHLVAGMAHEIGNPLAAVMGYIELLKEELPEGRQRDLVDFAGIEFNRIDRLVRELLDYARPGHEQEEIFDPLSVVKETLALLERQGLFGAVTLVEDLPDRLPCVKMVPQRLVQVFVNLLVNARDASPSRGRICVAAGETDTRVWFSVADEGQGIPADDMAHIFNPFFTTKAPGKGRGLGLSVCHRVVEEAGGTIEVQSEFGKGSVFVVRLKREASQNAE